MATCSSHTFHYYVVMSCNPTTHASNQEHDQIMVNLEDLNIELNNLPIPNQTQECSTLIDILSLTRLSRRRIHGKEPLVDYSMSHVVTYKLILNNVEAKDNGQKSYK